jgi:hypothetical protein
VAVSLCLPPNSSSRSSIGRLAAPLDSAQLADFVAGLEPVNAAAESASAFVWADHRSLWDFVYDDDHRAILRRRREFFGRMTEAYKPSGRPLHAQGSCGGDGRGQGAGDQVPL